MWWTEDEAVDHGRNADVCRADQKGRARERPSQGIAEYGVPSREGPSGDDQPYRSYPTGEPDRSAAAWQRTGAGEMADAKVVNQVEGMDRRCRGDPGNASQYKEQRRGAQ